MAKHFEALSRLDSLSLAGALPVHRPAASFAHPHRLWIDLKGANTAREAVALCCSRRWNIGSREESLHSKTRGGNAAGRGVGAAANFDRLVHITWLADGEVALRLPEYYEHAKTVLEVTAKSGLDQRCWVNHFPGAHSIVNKAPLGRTLNRFRRLLSDDAPEAFDFFPRTFLLPQHESQCLEFLESRPSADLPSDKKTLIVKPSYGSKGNGIELVQSVSKLRQFSTESRVEPETMTSSLDCTYVAQEYLPPLLLRGLKFDFRLYLLLVASDDMAHPDAFLCKEGLVRFATMPYAAPTRGNLSTRTMHLTNYSVNKTSRNFVAEGGLASKQLLSAVLEELAAFGKDSEDRLWGELERLAAHTALALGASLHSARRAFASDGKLRNCFQVFGLDVMLTQLSGDSPPKASLLEVNANPALALDHCGSPSPVDHEVKSKVVSGALQCIETWDSKLFCQHGGHSSSDFVQVARGNRLLLCRGVASKAVECAGLLMTARHVFEAAGDGPTRPFSWVEKIKTTAAQCSKDEAARSQPQDPLAARRSPNTSHGKPSPQKSSVKSPRQKSPGKTPQKSPVKGCGARASNAVPSYYSFVTSHIKAKRDPAPRFALTRLQFLNFAESCCPLPPPLTSSERKRPCWSQVSWSQEQGRPRPLTKFDDVFSDSTQGGHDRMDLDDFFDALGRIAALQSAPGCSRFTALQDLLGRITGRLRTKLGEVSGSAPGTNVDKKE